ncbi:MAG: hypothetical protein QOD32_1376 [Pyrinomonadaceae bacterium]|jgi:hypothetical protein|nr:hypothetical protein [Pyrinomonadaceae bacterium]
MNRQALTIIITALFLTPLFLMLPGGAATTVHARESVAAPPEPEAYLRHETGGGANAAPGFYIEVYMKTPLAGQGVGDIRASLRDTGKGRLISSSVASSTEGDSNFRIPFTESEADIIKQMGNYVVFVDAYPTASGNLDKQIKVATDVTIETERNDSCNDPSLPFPHLPFSITVTRATNFPYALRRIEAVKELLNRPEEAARLTDATVTVSPAAPQRSVVRRITLRPPGTDSVGTQLLFACVALAEPPPSGGSTFSMDFIAPAPFELRQATLKFELSGLTPPKVDGERTKADFLDLGVTLTSSVADEKQEDETTKRERTTRGVLDLWFAPILNLRKVKAVGTDGGLVQIFTPFYIDAKVSTGKITEDTLALNRINLGSTYEFRHYLNSNDYPDLMRHSLSFQHSSDRDFKQDEAKFIYEFQPSFGAINQPLGSAPDIVDGKPVPNQSDKFGLQIVPLLGVELGRTYRVRDPKDFEGINRNVYRFYFGTNMTFEVTKHFKLSLLDRFYVRGETPDDRGRNYFTASVEAPLISFGTEKRQAAHALFFSFERGDQPPFTSPGVNVFKFGYRIRGRVQLSKQ